MQGSATVAVRGRVRVALAAGIAGAAAAWGLLTGCTPDLGGADDARGSRQPSGGLAPVEPGQFSVLPEPCEAVDEDTLHDLLPGGGDEAYQGEPMATYDTGRRVGCTWRVPTETTTRKLTVDLERVLSYDPEISDDQQAELDFEALAAEVGVPLDGSPPPSNGLTTSAGKGATDDVDAGLVGESSTPSGDLASRPLDDIGHVAFLDDQLTSNNTQAIREVLVGFRSANVIVTVKYTVSTTVAGQEPDSQWLQDGAREVARQLARGFDG